MLKSLPVVLLSLLATPALAAPPPRDMSNFAGRMLEGHNLARRELGLASLQWDEALARDADDWARGLAYRAQFEHSHAEGVGENLWMGTVGRFTYEDMLESWAREKLDYRHGAFPDVSPSGRVVGHYTQMVWSTTTHVGCALAPSDRFEYLVCRYSPQGNWIGQRAY
ncbi:MAG: CAP domain-containing protein [Caulobacter sp.]|nr:CAP domain-containing protein [Caulobacter sp.]